MNLRDFVPPVLLRNREQPVRPPSAPIFEPDLVGQVIALGREYQPSDLYSFRSAARSGNPELLFGLYGEMPRFGIGPQVGKARDAVKGCRFTLGAYPAEYQDESIRTPDATLAREIADAVRDQFEMLLPELFGEGFTLHEYGICGQQYIGEPGEGHEGTEAVKEISLIPPGRYRLNPWSQDWRYLPNAFARNEVLIAPFVESGAMIFMEEGRGVVPIDQRGLYFQSLIPWCVMQFGMRWWAKFIELYGIPPRQITYQKGDSSAKAEAEAIGRMTGAQGFAAIPDNIKLTFHDQMGGRGAATYHENLLEWIRRWFDSVWLGHSQGSGVQPGAGSIQSTEKADADFDRLTNARAARLANEYRRQLFRKYVLRNWGPDAARKFTPSLAAAVAEKVDGEKFSRAVLNLYNADAGEGISLAQVVTQVGLSMPKKGEETLGRKSKKTPAQPPAAPASNDDDEMDKDERDKLPGRKREEKDEEEKFAALPAAARGTELEEARFQPHETAIHREMANAIGLLFARQQRSVEDTARKAASNA